MNLIQNVYAASAIESAGENATTAVTETTSGLTDFFGFIWDQIPYFVAAVAIIIVSYFVSKYARSATEKALMRTSRDAGALDLIGKSAQAGVMITGIATALQIMHIDLSLILSAFGFGIGFALKDIISNYLAGILILIQEPFKIGEVISVGDTMGTVEAIESRNIVLRNFDGQRVIVTNTDIFTTQITNYSHYPERRVTLPIGVDYTTDLPRAIRIIQTVLSEHKSILRKPRTQVFFTEFGDSSINLEVRFWVSVIENWWQTRSEVITQIKREFDLNDINIPFPITTLKTDKGKPIIAEMTQLAKIDHRIDVPTTALGIQGDKVPEFGSTDNFDPQAGDNPRRVVKSDKVEIEKEKDKNKGKERGEQSNKKDAIKSNIVKKDHREEAKGDDIFDTEVDFHPVTDTDSHRESDKVKEDKETPLFM